jgi:hypothetical protein
MYKVYVSYCTEYEAGWGQRPDGVMIGTSLKVLTAEVKRRNAIKDNPSYFWRYTEPIECQCNYQNLKKIKEKKDIKDVAHFGNNYKQELELFKQL